MKTLTGNNMATCITPWAAAALPHAYDAGPTLCDLNVYDTIYDYDVTRCIPSSTSSTSVATTLSGASEFTADEACFPDPAGGREREPPELGVSLYGYRYYKPEMGRWLNRDPMGEVGGVNLYAGMVNNLITRIDLHGLSVVQSHYFQVPYDYPISATSLTVPVRINCWQFFRVDGCQMEFLATSDAGYVNGLICQLASELPVIMDVSALTVGVADLLGALGVPENIINIITEVAPYVSPVLEDVLGSNIDYRIRGDVQLASLSYGQSPGMGSSAQQLLATGQYITSGCQPGSHRQVYQYRTIVRFRADIGFAIQAIINAAGSVTVDELYSRNLVTGQTVLRQVEYSIASHCCPCPATQSEEQ